MCIIVLDFFICRCLGVLHIISLYALSLHNSAHSSDSLSSCVRQNKEDRTLRTITLIYYKSYYFIYSHNTTVTVTYMYMKRYLSEPCVGCSFHTSLSSICFHAGVKCQAFSHLSIPRNQEQADWHRASHLYR